MTKKMKLVATLATLLIAAAGVMTFEACNKSSINSNDNVQTEIKNIGLMHNEGLDEVYKSLKIEFANNRTVDTCVLELTKKTVDSYLHDEYYNDCEKLRISLSCSESACNLLLNEQNEHPNTIWFAENETSLTNKEKELLSCIDIILGQPNIDLDDVLAEFEIIKERVSAECTYEEKLVMNSAISVGEASCIYWYNNLDDWCILIGGNSRGWFDWGDVSREDIAGAIDGAVGGAVAGSVAGGIGALPGAGAGAVGGGLAASATSAVMQIWDHYFNN